MIFSSLRNSLSYGQAFSCPVSPPSPAAWNRRCACTIRFGYVCMYPRRTCRLAALSVLLTLFQSVNELAPTGQKKTPAGPKDPRSSCLFPKASAKVRPFSLTGKFYRDFFARKCKKVVTGNKIRKKGKMVNLINYIIGQERKQKW